MATFATGSKYNAATHRMKIALWIARRKRPFSIVQDPELLDIFHDLNPNCVSPSRYTVSRDIQEILVLSRTKVGEILRVSLSFSDHHHHLYLVFCAGVSRKDPHLR
jgi:hypothetical protein